MSRSYKIWFCVKCKEEKYAHKFARKEVCKKCHYQEKENKKEQARKNKFLSLSSQAVVKTGESYLTRLKALKSIGFDNYSQYLRSGLWYGIRKKVFQKYGKKCCICGEKGKYIHHDSYCEQVLRGQEDFLHMLHPICETCHSFVEMDDRGVKLSFEDSQKKFRQTFLAHNFKE